MLIDNLNNSASMFKYILQYCILFYSDVLHCDVNEANVTVIILIPISISGCYSKNNFRKRFNGRQSEKRGQFSHY